MGQLLVHSVSGIGGKEASAVRTMARSFREEKNIESDIFDCKMEAAHLHPHAGAEPAGRPGGGKTPPQRRRRPSQ